MGPTYTSLAFKQPDGSTKEFVKFFETVIKGHHLAVLIPEPQMIAFLGGQGDIPEFETVEIRDGVYGPVDDDSVMPELNEMLDQKLQEAEDLLLAEEI
jgi:hypothetical protein